MNFIRNRLFRQSTGPPAGHASSVPSASGDPSPSNNTTAAGPAAVAADAALADIVPAHTTPAQTAPAQTASAHTSPTDNISGDNLAVRTNDVVPVSGAPPSETAPRAYSDVATHRTDGLVTPRELFNRFNAWPADLPRSRLQSSSFNKNTPSTSRAQNTPARSSLSRQSLRMFDPPLDEFGCPMSNIGVPDSMFGRPSSGRFSGRPASMRTPGRPSSVRLSERPASIRPSENFSSVRYSFGARAGRPPIREATEARLNRLSGRHSFRIPRYMQTPRPSSMPPGAAGVADVRAHVRSLADRGDRPSGTWAALNPPRSNTPPPFERRVLESLANMRKTFDRNPLGSVVKRKVDIKVPDLPIAKRRRLSGEFAAAGGRGATPGKSSAARGEVSVGGTPGNDENQNHTLSAEQRAAERASRLPIAWRSKVIYTGFGMGKRRSRKSALSKLAKTALEDDVRKASDVSVQNLGDIKDGTQNDPPQASSSQLPGDTANASHPAAIPCDPITRVNKTVGVTAEGLAGRAGIALSDPAHVPVNGEQEASSVGGALEVKTLETASAKPSAGAGSSLPLDGREANFSGSSVKENAKPKDEGVSASKDLFGFGNSTEELASKGFPAASSAEGKSPFPGIPSVATPLSKSEDCQDTPSNPVFFPTVAQTNAIASGMAASSKGGTDVQTGLGKEGLTTAIASSATASASLTSVPTAPAFGSASNLSVTPRSSVFGSMAAGAGMRTSGGLQEGMPGAAGESNRKKRRADGNSSTNVADVIPPLTSSDSVWGGPLAASGNSTFGQGVESDGMHSQAKASSSLFPAQAASTHPHKVQESGLKEKGGEFGNSKQVTFFATTARGSGLASDVSKSVDSNGDSVQGGQSKEGNVVPSSSAEAVESETKEKQEAVEKGGESVEKKSSQEEAPKSFASGFPLGPIPAFTPSDKSTALFGASSTQKDAGLELGGPASTNKEEKPLTPFDGGNKSLPSQNEGKGEDVTPTGPKKGPVLSSDVPAVPSFGSASPAATLFGSSAPSLGATAPSFGATVPSVSLPIASFGATVASFGNSGTSLGASAPSLATTSAALPTSASAFGATTHAFGESTAITKSPSTPAPASSSTPAFLFGPSVSASSSAPKVDRGPFADAKFSAPQAEQANMSTFVFGTGKPDTASRSVSGANGKAAGAGGDTSMMFRSAASTASGFAFGQAAAACSLSFGASAPSQPSGVVTASSAGAVAFGAASSPGFGTQFGSSAPSFGSNPSAFGGSSTPTFGATVSSFGPSATGFGASGAVFGSDGAPAPSFAPPSGRSNTGFGRGNDGAFGASTPAFGAGGTVGTEQPSSFGIGVSGFGQSQGEFVPPAPVSLFPSAGPQGGAFGGANGGPTFGNNNVGAMGAPGAGMMQSQAGGISFNAGGVPASGGGAFSMGAASQPSQNSIRRRIIRAKRMGAGGQR